MVHTEGPARRSTRERGWEVVRELGNRRPEVDGVEWRRKASNARRDMTSQCADENMIQYKIQDQLENVRNLVRVLYNEPQQLAATT